MQTHLGAGWDHFVWHAGRRRRHFLAVLQAAVLQAAGEGISWHRATRYVFLAGCCRMARGVLSAPGPCCWRVLLVRHRPEGIAIASLAPKGVIGSKVIPALTRTADAANAIVSPEPSAGLLTPLPACRARTSAAPDGWLGRVLYWHASWFTSPGRMYPIAVAAAGGAARPAALSFRSTRPAARSHLTVHSYLR